MQYYKADRSVDSIRLQFIVVLLRVVAAAFVCRFGRITFSQADRRQTDGYIHGSTHANVRTYSSVQCGTRRFIRQPLAPSLRRAANALYDRLRPGRFINLQGQISGPYYYNDSNVSHYLTAVIRLCCVVLIYLYRVSKKRPLFRLDALALSVIATATWLAGWLGGWVSVTLRYCIKLAKPIGKLFRPPESPIILVF